MGELDIDDPDKIDKFTRNALDSRRYTEDLTEGIRVNEEELEGLKAVLELTDGMCISTTW